MPPRHQFWLLFLAVSCLHLLGSWSLPLIDRDEPRFAEASREMLERHDYVVPYFNNQYRFDKPPLTYWLQSSAYRVFGENDFAARLHSALAAAGVAVVLLIWGCRMFDAATGWRAAVIFSLCLQVIMHAKASVADMLLIFFVTLAVWAGWEMGRASLKRRADSGWWWLFFTSLGLGFLAKGPVAWLPLIPVVVLIGKSEGRKRWAGLALGVLLMLGIAASWGIPALRATDGEFFKIGIGKHVVGRSLATMEGHGAAGLLGWLATMPLYFLTVWVSFAPWSMAFPGLIRHWRGLWSERDTQYLLWNVLLVFVAFSLVKTKLPHYTLPAFPMLALLVARNFDPARFGKAAIGMTAFVLVLTLVICPLAAGKFPAPSLARMSREVLQPHMEFASNEFEEPSLVWYFRKHINGFHFKVSPPKARKFMAKKGPRFYILPTAKVPEAFPQVDPAWKIYRHQGWNVAKFERVDLTMLVKTE